MAYGAAAAALQLAALDSVISLVYASIMLQPAVVDTVAANTVLCQ
jgi:hypothetical protein